MQAFGLGVGARCRGSGVVDQSLATLLVTAEGGLCLLWGPGLPACALRRRNFKLYAVDRAHGQAQLTAGTKHLDHGVHAFVGAHNRVGGTGIQAQGAADAPVFINPGDLANPLQAVLCIQGGGRLASELGQTAHALFTTGGAAVNGGVLLHDGLGIGLAVFKAAALALGLRQQGPNRLDWVKTGEGLVRCWQGQWGDQDKVRNEAKSWRHQVARVWDHAFLRAGLGLASVLARTLVGALEAETFLRATVVLGVFKAVVVVTLC